MIYVACGSVMMVIGIIWLISPVKSLIEFMAIYLILRKLTRRVLSSLRRGRAGIVFSSV